MNGHARLALLLFCDAVLINLSIIIAYIFRFESLDLTAPHLLQYYKIAPMVVLVYLAFFYVMKLYNRVWAYASISELIAIVQAVTLGSLGFIALTYLFENLLPRSIILSSWALLILLVGASRLSWRLVVERKKGNGHYGKRTLIIGAGDAGVLVARELKNHDSGLMPVGFIDDDKGKQRMRVLDLPVLGGRQRISLVVKRYNIETIIIAMPSADAQTIRELVAICNQTGLEVKILPGMYQLIDGRVSVSHLRPVKIEDLLHREPVKLNLGEISDYIKGETVLVTGAGGSIGSELCRQVAGFAPKKLVLLGHGENSIHKIWLELSAKYPDLPLGIEIADVRDQPKINYIFQQNRPGLVFHAAAHKHVPLMELHPDEAVKTNIFGTKNLAEAADRAGAKTFVLISTDKAVNPSSVMGATKRMAELIVQHMARISHTRFVAVRFGNVLGSRGSVVPIFEEQIKNGGPVTVTDPEMKRYFMTIPEAVQLVIQAGSMADGGEVFILDMGEPVKIVDLACEMIRLSGLEPEKDIKIKFIGARPGEKLFEELLTAEEGSAATKHKRIFVAKPCLVDIAALEQELLLLAQKTTRIKDEDVFAALAAILPNFKCYRKVRAV
ncbi:polysaccharide biosynthesis protein [Desulfallas thermosapovorans]|uniref:FlaA1/EpsC-like NDP-sugar epimerase n=1 Tax=Desulfallas thermosapovorans DSM 6562 TaxID=1121431 RepID=A0A5S4ZMU7_9FIRM|nr:nucleoside-diphosphate sugar epimerase/dehydratase [Desulfallas thermosapovorans]TYO93251.1 FlaA1/EpsC-like NDP-sugar epimerase [Desulfallas thermosapovorans DSM 6562]